MTAVGATIARGKIFQSCQRSGTRIADDACLAIPLHAGIGITFTQALYEAKKDGWTVISMKSGMTMQGKVIPLWLERADGSEETLTASEFDLLEVFAKHPNRPLQRDWLLEVTAHREMDAFDRAIDQRITRLRRKIEPDPAHPEAIRTVRGVGYMFVPPTE